MRLFESLRGAWAAVCIGAAVLVSVPVVAEVAPAAPVAADQELDDEVAGEGESSIREHVEQVVRDAVQAYLQGMGIRHEGLDVAARPQLDAYGKVESLQVQVAITTDIEHPEQIGREARQAAQRALIDDGYRFLLPGVDTSTLPPEIASRPVAQLALTVEYPQGPKSWQERLELEPILVFSAIVLLMLGGFYLCWLMTLRFFRALFPPPAGHAVQAPATPYEGAAAFPPDLVGLPPLPGAMAREEPALDLELPPLKTPEPGQEATLPPLPGPAPTAQDDGAARQALISAFADMPFDKAVRALSAFDASTRAAILEKLGLHLSVRRRIEQELAELSRS